jgi:hypothetical protein
MFSIALLATPAAMADAEPVVTATPVAETDVVADGAGAEGTAAPEAPAASEEPAGQITEGGVGDAEADDVQQITEDAATADTKSKFPLGAAIGLTNSLGTGTFAPGYTNNPSLNTSLSIKPSFNIPKLLGDWQPAASLSAGISADMEWMSSYTGSGQAGTYDRQVRIRDMSFAASFPALINETFSGISVSPVLALKVPLSVYSRYQNRLVGVSGAAPISWSLETMLGNFSAAYSPSASGWFHSEKSATQPCGSEASPFFNVGQDATDGLTDHPTIVSREGEVSDVNGNCITKGRQSVASVANAASLGWSYPDFFGSHSVSAGFGVYHGFLRPINDLGAGTSSSYANNSSTTLGSNTPSELTDGSLSYTYGLPTDLNLSVTAGIYSLQTMWDQQGDFRFPWFDFNVQSGNNFTRGFLTLNLAL